MQPCSLQKHGESEGCVFQFAGKGQVMGMLLGSISASKTYVTQIKSLYKF